MQNSENTASQSCTAKKINFLSQYDSYQSESHSHRIKHIKSAKIMRKLKQLWNRQKYLTDDEMQSGLEQRGAGGWQEGRRKKMETERRERRGELNKLLKEEQCGQSRKRTLERKQSEEEEHMNVIRKRSNCQPVRSKEATKRDSNDMEQLSQIAAFNSEVEDQSK